MQFQKGQSGNPSGRPPGARNKATLIAEALLQGEAEAMTRVAIERAKAGDTAALRMCLDRLAPPCRHRTVEFELPPLTNAQDAVSALAAITAAVSAGELTPAEAGDLSKLMMALRACVRQRFSSDSSRCWSARSADRAPKTTNSTSSTSSKRSIRSVRLIRSARAIMEVSHETVPAAPARCGGQEDFHC